MGGPLEHNKTNFGGQPYNSPCPTLAASAVTALDEIAQRHCWLGLIGFHELIIRRVNGSPLLGISPRGCFVNFAKYGMGETGGHRTPDRASAKRNAALWLISALPPPRNVASAPAWIRAMSNVSEPRLEP